MTKVFKFFIISFSIFLFTACDNGSSKNSNIDTTTEQNDYRLVLEIQQDLSTDYYSYNPYYSDRNLTYSYDADNNLIQITTYNQNGGGNYTKYTYDNNHVPITRIQQRFSADGTVTTYYKSVWSDSQNLLYEDGNYLTDGIDSIRTETLQDGKIVRLSFDGFYDITPGTTNLLYVYGYDNRYDPYDDTSHFENDGTIDAEISFVYNDKGLVTNKLFDTDMDGNYEHNVTFEYDQNTNPVYAVDTDGNYESWESNCSDDNTVCHTAFDQNGSVTLITHFLNEQQQTVKENTLSPQGVETNTTYTYTQNGEILTKTFVSGGEEEYTHFTYDENGRMTHFESTFESIAAAYLSAINNHYFHILSSSPYDFVVYDFTYDSNGNMIKQVIYDNPNGIPTITVDYTWEKVE